MKSIVVIAAVVIVAAVVAGGIVLSSPGTAQTASNQPSSKPQQQAMSDKTAVSDIKNSPSTWAGKNVVIEGLVNKDGLLSSPYLIEDKGASLSLSSKDGSGQVCGLEGPSFWHCSIQPECL